VWHRARTAALVPAPVQAVVQSVEAVVPAPVQAVVQALALALLRVAPPPDLEVPAGWYHTKTARVVLWVGI
jgi:hypothetical protein